eukprot:c23100_g2_i1 orf=414-704(+)
MRDYKLNKKPGGKTVIEVTVPQELRDASQMSWYPHTMCIKDLSGDDILTSKLWTKGALLVQLSHHSLHPGAVIGKHTQSSGPSQKSSSPPATAVIS